ncbi:MAG: aminoglycoside phosphotransferase family protein [Saprospiraceae bacterium]
MIPKEVLDAFLFSPDACKISRFGNGLIHETYLLEVRNQRYLLQKLNHRVFKDLVGVMSNITSVLDFLHHSGTNYSGLQFLSAMSGSNLVLTNNEYWRAMIFIDNSISHEKIQNSKQAFEAGKIVGDFHSKLSNFESHSLVHTIPHFHDFQNRLTHLNEAAKNDIVKRKSNVEPLLDYLITISDYIINNKYENELPTRVTHNDTKLNNILFDSTDTAICLVDFDTLMPGKITFDTGDALRTMCNPAGEDGSHGVVEFRTEYFYQFTKGYIQQGRGLLKNEELAAIPFSIIRMTVEQAIRFLTDYLEGDVYYHQPYEGFNFNGVKAQVQFSKLLKDMMADLEHITHELIEAESISY